MIVQEDVPYTKEEVKAMVKTIHDLRKKVSQLGWHPASELPPVETDIVVWCILDDGQLHVGSASLSETKWPDALGKYVKRWCYPTEKYKVRS
jgi:hypothetical protein